MSWAIRREVVDGGSDPRGRRFRRFAGPTGSALVASTRLRASWRFAAEAGHGVVDGHLFCRPVARSVR